MFQIVALVHMLHMVLDSVSLEEVWEDEKEGDEL
jgi:hypothetical protein